MPCSFDELVPLPVQPSCHELSVPEDWADPDPDDRVVLQVAVFEGDGSIADPIIYFDGGPGGHTLDSLAFSYSNLIEPFLGRRDYIVFDQRGLGESEPSLACPEVNEIAFEDLAGRLDDPAGAQIDASDACRERLVDSGVNLEAYNSIASANDVEALRSLLGYEQVNVVGISYGTRLAQSYMRMYPQSIRSVVLDSVFPTGYDLWTNFEPGAARAFDQLFDGCARSSECAAAYPDFEDRFFEFLDRLDAQPIEVQARDLLDGSTVQVVLDGDDVMGLVFNALYDRSQFAAVPQMVVDGLEGRYETIELLASVLVTNLDFVSLGMRLSVECNEEIPFESEETMLANRAAEGPYARLADLDGGLTLFDLCETWPAGTAPTVEAMPVESDIPTLVLAGQYDPITPPAGADQVTAGLTNAYSFLLPHEGHGITPTGCGSELVAAFIDDPGTEPNDSCIADSPAPFWTPLAEQPAIELVEFQSDGLVTISGVRPDGWTDAGNGVFVRQQTAVDPTSLVIQPTGGLGGEALINLLAGQLELNLVADEPVEIDGTVWERFSSPTSSQQAARAAVKPGTDGVLVLLVARSEEIDALFDEIFVPVASAATPG